MEILTAICTMFQKLSPPPPKNTVFKKATIFYNYLIYLYSRISNMYIKQIVIYYYAIYLHTLFIFQ